MSGGKILLTAFACIIDLETNEVEYSNASHIDALIIPGNKKKEIEKSDIIPLTGAKNPRLGHKEEVDFLSEKYKLEPGDTIVLLTDGITEAENSDAKQFGIRRLVKSIIKLDNRNSETIRSSILQDVNEFCGRNEYDDDLTLACLQVQ